MLLHIIRHADPDYRNDTITDRGVAEAAAVAGWLGERRPDLLCTSPLGRARATVAPAERLLGVSACVLDWAAEFASPRVDDGTGDTGSVFWNVAGSHARDRRYGDDWRALPGYDETARADIEREIDRLVGGSDAWLASLGLVREQNSYRVVAEPPDEVVVVCHGGLGVTWMAHLLGIPPVVAWCGLFVAPASVTTVRFERRPADRATPRITALGDTGHLRRRDVPENLAGLPIGA